MQESGESSRSAAELPVSDGLFTGDKGDAVVMALEQLAEDLVQRPVLPVAAPAISFGELGRKRNDPVEAHVVAEKPPSMTTISPFTIGLLVIRFTMVTATSSGVTQRLSGVWFARLSMRRW